MNKTIFLFCLAVFSYLGLRGQVHGDSLRQLVLTYDTIDSTFIFGEWNDTGGTETHLRYLGLIKSNNGNLKILTSVWFWGLSKRATSRILVFTEKNEYLGNYYMKMTYDLPETIQDNQLVFLHSHAKDCDQTRITRLSFESGIPQEFFLECKDGGGDIYYFKEQ